MAMDTTDKFDLVRQEAEGDLEKFIRLVTPRRMLGAVHIELIQWWTRQDAKSHQLVLLPRDHQKSALVAYRVAWEITRNPAVRILYISSTSNLATKQLSFIKKILTSDIYRYYWPEMINVEEAKREKWTETEISVDHPKRKLETVRDPTIFTAGLTTTVTGLHCDIAVLDDVVVKENAYTEEGRKKVEEQYSLLSSVESTEGKEWAVGTRYHPNDLYATLVKQTIEEIDEEGSKLPSEALYEVFERQVESRGDGSGEYIWPVQVGYDGKKYGFDSRILARKRAQYLDRIQFRAQYYNDPNDPENAPIGREHFQYFDRKYLSYEGGHWYFKNTRLNVTAAIDFAFSRGKKADWTSIVVVGVDNAQNYYVLDIDRFKTDKISEYYAHILLMHQRWHFRKLRAEVVAAQDVIVKDLRTNYIQRFGLGLVVEDARPTRHEGTKEERIAATLEPRYSNRQMWHYQGGLTQTLEEELVMSNPPHDDIKDCLSIAVQAAVAPSTAFSRPRNEQAKMFTSHSRFGGVI
jgi:hypothetical protein